MAREDISRFMNLALKTLASVPGFRLDEGVKLKNFPPGRDYAYQIFWADGHGYRISIEQITREGDE